MDHSPRIDDLRAELLGVSWGFLIPVTLATFPAALSVGYALASGFSLWLSVAWIIGLLILPSLVTSWWLGWRDGNASATRCVVAMRWVVVASLVPIAVALFYGRQGGVFGILDYWMVGFHAPLYLVSRFVAARSRRRWILAELELAEAAAFVGRRCFLCSTRISGRSPARALVSGQFVHKTCERRDWSGNLGMGPGWFVMVAVVAWAVGFEWWPALMTGFTLLVCRPSMFLVFFLGWAEGRVSGDGATLIGVYLCFLGRFLVVFPFEIIFLDSVRVVPAQDVSDLDAAELFSLVLAAPVSDLVLAYIAAWFSGVLLSSLWRNFSGSVTRAFRAVRLA